MGHNMVILTVIAESVANTKNLLEIKLPETVFFSDDGHTDFLCGKCKAVLADGITEGMLTDMVVKCNKCQSYNEFPVTKPTERPY